MCDPTAALAMQAAGVASSTAGAFYGAKAQKSALGAQAAIADINAKLSELTAQSALRSGQLEEQRVKLNTASLKSKQRVALAGNGVDLSSDSAINTLTSTDVMGEIDANTTAANAARAAWGYRVQGMNYQNEAIGARATSKGINPFMSAATTALTGAGDVAMTRYKLGKEGALPKDSWWNFSGRDAKAKVY